MAGGENLDQAKRFLERCDFIGLTEHFNLSLQVFGTLAPRPMNLRYRRLIVARDNQIQKNLLADPRMLELARKHNQLDLELYAFAANEIFPKLCRKAGLNPLDKVASFEVSTNDLRLKYKFGRVYNKVFRQIYKVRRRVFHDVAGGSGNGGGAGQIEGGKQPGLIHADEGAGGVHAGRMPGCDFFVFDAAFSMSTS